MFVGLIAVLLMFQVLQTQTINNDCLHMSIIQGFPAIDNLILQSRIFVAKLYLLSSFIMFLVCISNECTAVNTLEQSFFSGKSV